MCEKEFKKLEEMFNETTADNGVWILSILTLLLMNKSDNEKTVINIFLGDE